MVSSNIMIDTVSALNKQHIKEIEEIKKYEDKIGCLDMVRYFCTKEDCIHYPIQHYQDHCMGEEGVNAPAGGN